MSCSDVRPRRSSPRPAGERRRLQWSAEHEASAVATTICLHDDLPGSGDSVSENREVGVVPVLARLRFLLANRTPSGGATGAGGHVRRGGDRSLTWPYGAEPDLAGYRVYRSPTSGGPYQPVGPFLDRAAFVNATVPRGTAVYYVIRAADT